MLPAWLRWNETTRQYEVIEDRANIVREIFAKTDAGWGKHRITSALNEAQVETWSIGKRKGGARWHSSYIQRLLTNEAVVGTSRRTGQSRPLQGASANHSSQSRTTSRRWLTAMCLYECRNKRRRDRETETAGARTGA